MSGAAAVSRATKPTSTTPSEATPLLGSDSPANGSRPSHGRRSGSDADGASGSRGATSRRRPTSSSSSSPPSPSPSLAPARIVRIVAAVVGSLLLVVFLAVLHDELRQRKENPRIGSGRNNTPFLASGTRGAVATENGVCSNVGVQVLKDGGNAVDSAIASTLCIGVLDMFSSGIGGGGFMVVRVPKPCDPHLHDEEDAAAEEEEEEEAEDDDEETSARRHRKWPHDRRSCADHVTLDFRETGPALANATMYVGRPESAKFGGLAVGVPGELRGLEEAHGRWGKLPWKRLFRPSIELAKGARVSRELERRLKFSSLFGDFITTKPEWRDVFVNADTGLLLREGDAVRRPALARTLEAVAEHGADVFYRGAIAESMVAKVREEGGVLSVEDLASYRVESHEAIVARWYDRYVWTSPAPSSGPVLLSVLQVLAGYRGWVEDGASRGLSAHRFVESLKFASAQRTRLGDPAFLDAEAREYLRSNVTTRREASRVRSRIDDATTFGVEYYEPLYDTLEDHGTMHLSVVDRDGMAVALTSTVNLLFGSQVMDPDTGVILNDEMDDTSTPGVPNAFGLRPSPYNYPGAGKRPLSSMSPAIVEHADGSFYCAVGGSGGSRIYGSVAQVLLNLDWGMDVSASVERPRLHHQLLPSSVSAETGVEPHLLDALRRRGHEVTTLDINLAAAEVQAVVREWGPPRLARTFGASDSRKGGRAAAY